MPAWISSRPDLPSSTSRRSTGAWPAKRGVLARCCPVSAELLRGGVVKRAGVPSSADLDATPVDSRRPARRSAPRSSTAYIWDIEPTCRPGRPRRKTPCRSVGTLFELARGVLTDLRSDADRLRPPRQGTGSDSPSCWTSSFGPNTTPRSIKASVANKTVLITVASVKQAAK